jgi:tetratricopeptide (TPR) repeat protein
MNRQQRRAEAKKGGPEATARKPAIQSVFAEAVQRHEAGLPKEAERLFRQVLTIDPHHAGSLHRLGVIAFQSGRHDQAISLIARAIEHNPGEASAHSNLGIVMYHQGRMDEAVACFREALAITPAFSQALNNLGNTLKALKRHDEAIACYREALSLQPDDPEVRYSLAMALLAAGDMAAGWAGYESRWETPGMAQARRRLAQPQWRGEDLSGRTLLIHAEQGFGDTIQFCRYAPLAAARGARVIMDVPKPLARLLNSLQGVDQVVVHGEPLPDFDLHCPMLSLPLAFGTTIDSIPADVPYLYADAARAAWHGRLAALETEGPRIGIVWAGDAKKHHFIAEEQNRRRSIAPGRLAPLFQTPGARFFSLQKEGPAQPRRFPLTDFMDEMTDFAHTAALIANLDLVISVDTAVAHLAGALGKPVWMLDRFDPCWRWLSGRRDSPWYPGLRLYRQPRPGDWETVIAEVARDLRGFDVGH